jgi:hypothetical protein
MLRTNMPVVLLNPNRLNITTERTKRIIALTSPASKTRIVSECGAEKFVHRRKKKLVGKAKTTDGLSVTKPSGLKMGITSKVATTTKYRLAAKYGNQEMRRPGEDEFSITTFQSTLTRPVTPAAIAGVMRSIW